MKIHPATQKKRAKQVSSVGRLAQSQVQSLKILNCFCLKAWYIFNSINFCSDNTLENNNFSFLSHTNGSPLSTVRNKQVQIGKNHKNSFYEQ